MILYADLAGQTDVVLDYWLKETSGGGRSDDFSVSISANGTDWVTPAALTTAGSSTYEHFVFDMDSPQPDVHQRRPDQVSSQ